MSLELAKRAIQRAQLRDNDRKWFPQWLARYAAWGNRPANQELPVVREWRDPGFAWVSGFKLIQHGSSRPCASRSPCSAEAASTRLRSWYNVTSTSAE
ncbi:MAG: hypothetical protein O3C40_25695 [Planctomycetota bacterium]|nr:hypothetical protein [Planctomycetota bacterium]